MPKTIDGIEYEIGEKVRFDENVPQGYDTEVGLEVMGFELIEGSIDSIRGCIRGIMVLMPDGRVETHSATWFKKDFISGMPTTQPTTQSTQSEIETQV